MRKWSVLVLLILLVSCSGDGDGRESFGDKHECSILEAVEYQSRSKSISSPELHEMDGYELLALPDVSGSKRLWIMLRPKSPPFYKQMPTGDFSISATLLDDLVRSGRVSSTVEEALRSHVSE